MFRKTLTNWGNYPKTEAEIIEVSDFNCVYSKINDINPIIARGNGRCYGDSALQSTVVSTLKMNKILFFDKEKGVLKCESGVVLSDILELVVPDGFFLPVTPGTKFITIGGAVASNVHGKNHHKEGAFSNFIISLDLLLESGEIITCSKTQNIDTYIATIGGMGLTGIITTVTILLKNIETSFIKQKVIKSANLNEILDNFDKYNNYTYSVAWIDCLKKGNSMGRSILILGEHALAKDLNSKNLLEIHSKKKLNVPFYFPNFSLNKFTISLFNTLYYHKQFVKEKKSIVHYDAFFYPLDFLENWNRIYGRNGFTQYQFVLPFDRGREGLNKIMKEITDSGCGSFLAVLKTFGKSDENEVSPLSFPKEGYTLALDFKINTKVFLLLNRLDKIVLEYNGRLYLTKDARMSNEMFDKTYPNFITSNNKFLSSQIIRLCRD